MLKQNEFEAMVKNSLEDIKDLILDGKNKEALDRIAVYRNCIEFLDKTREISSLLELTAKGNLEQEIIEAKIRAEIEAELKAKAEIEAKVQAEAKKKAKLEAEAKAKAEMEAKIRAKIEAEMKAETAKTMPSLETDPKVAPDTKEPTDEELRAAMKKMSLEEQESEEAPAKTTKEGLAKKLNSTFDKYFK